MLPDWPRAHGGPLFDAEFRRIPDEFRVTEDLGFDAAGDGEHDLLHIEKTSTNTQWLARQLARHAGIPSRDVGYCGLKDRHAVTSQWFSVRRPDASGTDWEAFRCDGVRVLSVGRHDRKLRPGSHRANRFEIVLHAASVVNVSSLDERIARIRREGIPNYFGEQRFGRDGGNLALARQLFADGHMRREQRSIALSAARAYLFNEILAARVEAGCWDKLLPGERANLAGSGSTFAVDRVDATLDERCRRHDIHPTASLWGDGAPLGTADVAELEAEVTSRTPDLATGLHSARVRAASRATRLDPAELFWGAEGKRVELGFELTTVAKAPGVLREIATARAA